MSLLVEELQFVPGMSAEVMIVTGASIPLEYLLKPMLIRGQPDTLEVAETGGSRRGGSDVPERDVNGAFRGLDV